MATGCATTRRRCARLRPSARATRPPTTAVSAPQHRLQLALAFALTSSGCVADVWPRPTLVKCKPGDAVLVLWHTMHSSTRVEGPDPRCMYANLCMLLWQGSLVTSDQGFCGRVYFRISSPLRPEGNQRICPDAMRDVSALLRVAPPLPVLADSEGLNVADVVYRSGASGRGLQSTFERRSSSRPRPSRQPSCRQ